MTPDADAQSQATPDGEVEWKRVPYPLKRRFLLLVVPLLTAALAGLLIAFSQALSLSAEHAYQLQAAAWHETLLRTAEQADPAAWSSRLRGGDAGEVQAASKAIATEVAEMGWICAMILDSQGDVIATADNQSCKIRHPDELQGVVMGNPLFREEDGPPMHWLVATSARSLPGQSPLIVVTSESSAKRERALSSETLLWLGGVGAAFAGSIGLGIAFISGAQVEINQRTTALNEAHLSLARFVSKNTSRRAQTGSGEPRRLLATVLFLDIRDFSSYAEAATPDAAASLVSAVANIGFEVIAAHHGDVDRLLGDGIIAWFEGDDRQANAWCAAGEILKRLQEAGLPREIGMGMHDGYLIEAEIGAGERKDATILGDTVNIAARLCARAEPGELIASRVVGEPPQGSVLHSTGSGDLDLKGQRRMVSVVRYRLGSPVSEAGSRGSS